MTFEDVLISFHGEGANPDDALMAAVRDIVHARAEARGLALALRVLKVIRKGRPLTDDLTLTFRVGDLVGLERSKLADAEALAKIAVEVPTK